MSFCNCCNVTKSTTQNAYENTTQRQNESNIKMQLMKKDKALLSYSKSLSDSKIQIEKLQRSLNEKDQDIIQLRETIQNLSSKIDSSESMAQYQNEKMSQFKQYIDLQMSNTNSNLRKQIDKYNEVVMCLKDTEVKLNNVKKENEMLSKELEEKEKEIVDKDDNIKYLQVVVNNLKNENAQINSLYNKNVELQNIVRNYENEINNYKDIIDKIKLEMNEQNNKYNDISMEFSQREQKLNNQIFILQKEVNAYGKNYQMKNDDWEIMKNAYEKLNRETEQYTIFMTNKSNELSEFIDAVIESTYAVDKMMNEEMLKRKNCNQQNDIKFEIIDDSFFKIKKKILDFVKLQKGIQNKLIKQFDEVNQSNENYHTEIKKLKDTNNTLFKDNEKLNDKVTELTKNLDTFNHSYENLKDVYTKLYGDYQMFTDKNERYVNDTQAYITKMIGKFENLIPIDNNKDELTQNELLKKCISTLIEKYKDLQEESNTLKQKTQKITNEKEDREKKLKEEVNKVKEENESLKKKYENDINKQKEITLDKIKQITSLLDESKKIISHYEEENKELKNENEKCTYRYKMLLLAQNQPE